MHRLTPPLSHVFKTHDAYLIKQRGNRKFTLWNTVFISVSNGCHVDTINNNKYFFYTQVHISSSPK